LETGKTRGVRNSCEIIVRFRVFFLVVVQGGLYRPFHPFRVVLYSGPLERSPSTQQSNKTTKFGFGKKLLMWNDEHWTMNLPTKLKVFFCFRMVLVHLQNCSACSCGSLPLIWNKERLLYLQGTSPYPTYGWKRNIIGPQLPEKPGDVGSQGGIFPATLKALGQLLTPPYHLDLQGTSRDLAPTSAGPAASIAGSIWLTYIYVLIYHQNLPSM